MPNLNNKNSIMNPKLNVSHLKIENLMLMPNNNFFYT